MSRWSQQFENHAFKNTWISVKERMYDAELEKKENEDAAKEIARLKKVVGYVDSVMEQVDPDLMPTPLMNAMNTHSASWLNELNAFKGDQNLGHLQNANNSADQVIISITQTPFALLGQQKGALTKAATEYSAEIDAHLARFKTKVDSEIDDTRNSVETIEAETSKLEREIESLKTAHKKVAQVIEGQTSEFNTQFQMEQKARSSDFDALTKKLQDSADKQFEKVSTKSITTIQVLDKFLDDARSVFGVVINTLQAGAYSSYANAEKKTANGLRLVAFALMITGVAILVVPEVAHIIDDIDTYTLEWKNVLGRSFFALILFIPGFYVAKESSRHRDNEILNRRRELILSTIDPYLALLDDEKAEEIKTEIAKSIFSEGALSANPTSNDANNLFTQITNLIKQISKTTK